MLVTFIDCEGSLITEAALDSAPRPGDRIHHRANEYTVRDVVWKLGRYLEDDSSVQVSTVERRP